MIVDKLRLGVTTALAFLLAGCSLLGASGLRGKYETSPGSGYGFDFADSSVVYSMVGDRTVLGTYTVDGSNVKICIMLCTILRIDGDCLQDDHSADRGRYCRGPA